MRITVDVGADDYVVLVKRAADTGQTIEEVASFCLGEGIGFLIDRGYLEDVDE